MNACFLAIILWSIRAPNRRVDSSKVHGLKGWWVRSQTFLWYLCSLFTQTVQGLEMKSLVLHGAVTPKCPWFHYRLSIHRSLQHCLYFFFLTLKSDGCHPSSLPRCRDSSPYVDSYLEPTARNSCVPHGPHFPSLLPSSSLEPSPLWMFLCEFPICWVKTLDAA